MMKKLLLPIVALYMFTHLVGCSSNNVQEDDQNVAAADDENFAEEGEGDFADGSEDSEESEDAGDEGGEEQASTDSDKEGEAEDDGGDEEATDVAEGEDADAEDEEDVEDEDSADIAKDESGEEQGDDESEFPEEVAEETTAAPGENVAASETPSDENLFTGDNAAAIPPGEPAPSGGDTASQPAEEVFKPAEGEDVAAAPPPTFAPLQKIKDAPYEKDGVMLNRVYVARKGDTVKSISQKIYGSDRAKEIRGWNPGLSASPRVGTKIYYNSPREPQDSARMITYYEDMGIEPQRYVTKDGENIRPLAQQLLGHPDSWKEIWSTNMDVASKGDLPSGVELKYWPEGSDAAAVPIAPVAVNDPAPTDPQVGAAPIAPAPPTDPTQAPGTNPGDPSAVGAVAPPPDPDMPAEPPIAPPPPLDPGVAVADAGKVPEPEPIAKKPPRETAEAVPAEQDTQLMLGIAGVVLLAVVGGFLIMKKNRARRIDFSQTQV